MYQKPKTYLLVKESKYGIETFQHQDIARFNPAYKAMLIEFLKKTVKILEGEEKAPTQPQPVSSMLS